MHQKFLSQNNGKFAYSIDVLKAYDKKYKISTINFVYSCIGYTSVHYRQIFENIEPLDLKFLIYVENCDIMFIRSNLKDLLIMPKLTYLSNHMEAFEYVLIDDNELLYLTTIEYFTEAACNEPQLIILNIFNKTTQNWDKKLQNYRKFRDFHGCELVMLAKDIKCYGKGWMTSDSGQASGVIAELFEEIGKYLNYKTKWNFTASLEYDEYHCTFDENYRSSDKKLENVCFDVTRFEIQSYKEYQLLHFSIPFMDINEVILVTPGDAYTSYEKLLLPFDKMTWILIICLFATAFLTIFIISMLPKSIHNLFYGPNVKCPALNVISTFYGISQDKLPKLNFSRFILMMFILFCLIFRTCYQSKLFEFMTSTPRRPPPNSIQEMIERNYKLLARNNLITYNNVMTNDNRDWPELVIVNHTEYWDIFETQSQNSSAKLGIIIQLYMLNILNGDDKYNWHQLPDPFFDTHAVFVFHNNNFYLYIINRFLNAWIPTGIIDVMLNKRLGSKEKNIIFNEPQVLIFEDLEFGFYIWLGCCVVNFACFVLEKVCSMMCQAYMKHTKMMLVERKFEKVYPGFDDGESSQQNMKKREVFRLPKKKGFD
ncbi:unnamed protein product [Chironomus riparius]|uniref:Ionotropic receptor n=1 Tax=Chironomus riparius TaxID=315576 RepID=A0A9N9WW12_9DIPT|nr:unnamed protein product [Chironomus riparius]